MWTFVVTLQRDYNTWREHRFTFIQKDFQWHSMRDVFEQILDWIEEEEDVNTIIDVLNITQVM